MNIAQKIIEAHKLKFGSLPPLQQCSVSGSALFNADCMDILPLIPDKSVQLILADLPYGTTACKWDIVLPLDKLWEHYERIIKDDGAIVLTCQQPFTSALIMSNTKLFKYEWIWDKRNVTGHLIAKFMPMKQHESILIFCKNKTIYNPQFEIISEDDYRYSNTGRIRKTKKDTVYGDIFGGRQTETGKRFPKSILSITNTNSVGKKHPTEKPLTLFEYLIKTYTNENDLVLDNCAGSGTTAIACLNTKRQFIVMEKEPKYYDIILKRVGDFNKKFEPQTLFGNEM